MNDFRASVELTEYEIDRLMLAISMERERLKRFIEKHKELEYLTGEQIRVLESAEMKISKARNLVRDQRLLYEERMNTWLEESEEEDEDD